MESDSEQYELLTNVTRKDNSKITRKIIYSFIKRQNFASEFSLQITDSENPLFLYNFSITDAKFSEFQHEARLECSFQQFPSVLKDLFTKCQSQKIYSANINEYSSSPLLFITLRLETGSVILFMTKIIPATEKILNEYLAQQTTFYKTKYFESEARNRSLQEEIQLQSNQGKTEQTKLLSEFEIKHKQIVQQYQLEFEKLQTEKNSLENSFKTKISTLEQNCQEEIIKIRQSFQIEKDKFQQKYNEDIEKYTSYIKNGQEKYLDLQSKAKILDSELSQYKLKCSQQDTEMNYLKAKVETLEKEKLAKFAENDVNQQYLAKTNDQITKLSEQISKQQDDLQSKGEENKQLQQSIEALNSEKIRLQQEVQTLKDQEQTMKQEATKFYLITNEKYKAYKYQINNLTNQISIKDEQFKTYAQNTKKSYLEQQDKITQLLAEMQKKSVEILAIQKTNEALKAKIAELTRQNNSQNTHNQLSNKSQSSIPRKSNLININSILNDDDEIDDNNENEIENDPLSSPVKIGSSQISFCSNSQMPSSICDNNSELVTGFDDVPLEDIDYIPTQAM